MSEDAKPAGLDARIDAGLRDGMRVEGPADLRRRVMNQLTTESPSSSAWLGARLLPALGAAVGMVVVVGLLIIAWPGGPSPDRSAAVVSPPPAPVGSTPAPVPTAEPISERSDGRGDRSVAKVARPVRPRRRSADPPGWRSSHLEGLTLEQISLPAIPWDDPRPAALVLGDLDLPPVEVETSQPLTDQ